MTLSQFLLSNLPLVGLFVILFLAVAVVEYMSSSRGVKKLSTFEAVKFIDNKKHLLVDLRNYVEFEKGYIRGAKQIAIDALKHKPEEHIKKKETPVLLVDDNEMHAVSTASHLKKQGYKEVHVLKGGIKNWKKENLPLIK